LASTAGTDTLLDMPHTVTHFTPQQLLALVIPLFLFVAQNPNLGLGRLMVEVRRARHRDRYLQNTQQTQQRNIHAVSGIQICDTGNPVAADLSLRSHGHQDRHPTRIAFGAYGIEYQTVERRWCGDRYITNLLGSWRKSSWSN
jgi:hypothetical protein